MCLPAGEFRHAADAPAAQASEVRGHHRRRGAVPPRTHGPHPLLRGAAARPGAHRLPPPPAGGNPGGNLRDHRLPGTGDADRAADGRLFPGQGGPSQTCHGQEDRRGDGPAPRDLCGRVRGQGRTPGEGLGDLFPDGKVRLLWLQQVACRGLCPGGLPDRLPEGPPLLRVHGRQPHPGPEQHREGGQAHRRMQGQGRAHPLAGHQRERLGVRHHGSRHPLRVGGHQERWAGRSGADDRGASAWRKVYGPAGFHPPPQPRAREPTRDRVAHPLRGLRWPARQSPRPDGGARPHDGGRPARGP